MKSADTRVEYWIQVSQFPFVYWDDYHVRIPCELPMIHIRKYLCLAKATNRHNKYRLIKRTITDEVVE